MNGETHLRFGVAGPPDIAAAAALVADLAAGAGIEGELRERAVLGVTELARNLVSHASPGGYLLARTLHTDPEKPGIEVISVDSGPGVAGSHWIERHRLPGAPGTAGPGSGTGLGAVRDAADVFDFWSVPRQGTVVLARFDRGPASDGPQVGAVSVALLPGEGAGDRWAVRESGNEVWVLVVDGLGHGRDARAAADAALEVFGSGPCPDRLDEFVLAADKAMRPTRGGVLTVCRVRPDDDVVDFAGLGNVTARIRMPGVTKGLAVDLGTAGTEHRPAFVGRQRAPFPAGSTLVLYSDGVGPVVDLAPVDRMSGRDASLIAAVLHRDHADGRDDATMLVVRDRRDPPA